MSLDLQPGSLFANDFKIVKPLDEGGMGSVYVVEQESTGNRRALKLMLPSLVSDTKLRERFLLEAKIGSRIQSDHVVQVIAAGVEPAHKVPWLAMELLSGEELEARVHREGPLPRPLALEIARQLCHALSAAHAVGVVHRDLKPKNLFLCKPRISGAQLVLKVLDFGIAKVVAEAAMTTGTAGMGTPLWMAPEQTEISSHVGPETDLWSLGLIVYWMLTAKHYWLGAESGSTNVQTILRELVMDPLVPASQRAAQQRVAHLIPPGFDAWLGKCLQRPRAARWPSAEAAIAELERVLGAEPPSRAGPTAIHDEFATRPTYADGVTGAATPFDARPQTARADPLRHFPQHSAAASHAHLSQARSAMSAPHTHSPHASHAPLPTAPPHLARAPHLALPPAPYAAPLPATSPTRKPNVGVIVGVVLAGIAALALVIYFATRDEPKIARVWSDDDPDPAASAPPKATKAEECKKLFDILKAASGDIGTVGAAPDRYLRETIRTADKVRDARIGSAELAGLANDYVEGLRDQAAAAKRLLRETDPGAAKDAFDANGRVTSAYREMVDACAWQNSPPIPTSPFQGWDEPNQPPPSGATPPVRGARPTKSPGCGCLAGDPLCDCAQ